MDLNISFEAAPGKHLFTSSTLAEQWIVLAKNYEDKQVVLKSTDYLEFQVKATLSGETDAEVFNYSWAINGADLATLASLSAATGNAIGYIEFSTLAEVAAIGTAFYRKVSTDS